MEQVKQKKKKRTQLFCLILIRVKNSKSLNGNFSIYETGRTPPHPLRTPLDSGYLVHEPTLAGQWASSFAIRMGGASSCASFFKVEYLVG